MKRSHLVLSSFCVALAIADITLALTLPSPAPISAQSTPTFDGFDYSWIDLNPYIAHAGGGILGYTYTNSYEALLSNYQLGHRLFEFDFSLSSDGKVVATHDFTTTSADTFNSTLVEDKFHPISLNQLFDFLHHHPDVYIVTDTKYTDEPSTRSLLGQLCSAAEDLLDRTVLDRFIIQIYHPDMLPWVMDIYPWKSIIYTLYANPEWTPRKCRCLCQRKWCQIYYSFLRHC